MARLVQFLLLKDKRAPSTLSNGDREKEREREQRLRTTYACRRYAMQKKAGESLLGVTGSWDAQATEIATK